MFVKYTTYLFLILSTVLFVACKKAPNYPVEPTISFNNLRVVHDFGSYSDSVFITINFQDGDGDIGNDPVVSSFFDCFVEVYKKKNGTYVRVNYFDTTSFNYNGYLPLLSPYDITGPIDGTITYNLAPIEVRFDNNGNLDFYGTDQPFNKDDTLKFEVQIRDRENHYSNWTETSEYIVWEPF